MAQHEFYKIERVSTGGFGIRIGVFSHMEADEFVKGFIGRIAWAHARRPGVRNEEHCVLVGRVGIHRPENDAVDAVFCQRVPDAGRLDQVPFVEFYSAVYVFRLPRVESRPLYPRLQSRVVGMGNIDV